ncbi:hypothetical protein [Marinobacter sp. ELB17]|uniref:hypothetical protein n=1 Tax=Marinobacter sp. ELB17 TaxID=270374 RepID=UPI0000F360AB|nr:hypothetical protein [Marinobacter sp. ELB17]EAZ96999.1 hypothetical protein MELB17_00045 [Marinobacter sp. ELB17]
MNAEHYTPRERALPNGLVTVLTRGDDVIFAPYGGGFTRTLPEQEFLEHFRFVEPSEFEGVEYRAGQFDLDDYFETPLHGYTRGLLWNGFAEPVFELAQVAQIAKAFPGIAYNPERDMVLVDQGDSVEDDCRYELYAGISILVDGQIKRAYPVGTGCWTWVEAGIEDESD